MIDVRLLRNDPHVVKAALARRGKPELLVQLDTAISLDEQLRDITARRDTIRARVNELSKLVGTARRNGDNEGAEKLQAESRSLGDDEKSLAESFETVQGQLRDVMLRLPNLPHPDAPDGASDHDNPLVIGPNQMPASFTEHQRMPHWEIADELGILDNERAVKLSGAMFTMQRGAGAMLSRALCQYALDMNADAFEEIRPPSLVTTATLTATGQLPKFAEDAYAIERDDLWCIPTAEAPLTSMYAGEVLDEAQLETLKSEVYAIANNVLSSKDYWLQIHGTMDEPDDFEVKWTGKLGMSPIVTVEREVSKSDCDVNFKFTCEDGNVFSAKLRWGYGQCITNIRLDIK